ncbi:MAG: sigma 54-interacting transcriptional regulator [Magnetococcales bacterium]|nr:sigma 54-interacting transcriptional regulator [Magnetococcales bacterium]
MDASLARLAPFLDSLEEGILFLDRDRRLVNMNKAAATMLGQEPEQVIGQLCPSLFEGTACARACAKRGGCLLLPNREQSTQTLDLTWKRQDGVLLFLRIWAILLPEGGESTLVAVILRDRTREVLLEEEVSERLRLGKLVGQSPVMRTLIQKILRYARSDATVLILGESGTGKELVARALHENSHRHRQPYLRVHCAAFPENLLESELFGHAKGAFTGATTARMGRFEAANGGTILLDEIGEISPTIQVKLLRVLQEREVERLGENQSRTINVRVVAATNRDLLAMVQSGQFRADLYYRLKVLPLHVPALRERLEDVPLLAQTLLDEIKKPPGREQVRLSEEALAMLVAYAWPGNVRELGNALEYALVQGEGPFILPQHLPKDLSGQAKVSSTGEDKGIHYYRTPDVATEKEAILHMLQATAGNKVETARQLGMSRTTLWKRLKQYGIA